MHSEDSKKVLKHVAEITRPLRTVSKSGGRGEGLSPGVEITEQFWDGELLRQGASTDFLLIKQSWVRGFAYIRGSRLGSFLGSRLAWHDSRVSYF